MITYTHWVEKPDGELHREFFHQKGLRDAAAKKHESQGSKVLCPNEYTIANSEELAVFLNTRFRNSTTYDIAEQFVNDTILGAGDE